MNATLTFVPPGGGEQDYVMEVELPGAPQSGDYISIQYPGETGTRAFIVRRTWWHLQGPAGMLPIGAQDTPVPGRSKRIVVECEFARGIHDSVEHTKACDLYAGRGKQVKTFEASGY